MQEVEEISSQTASLEFTASWFIDAGILGFVNLIKEVYGNENGSKKVIR
ncbi:MAG: hypothetical protein H5T44_03885 [Thermoplasmatales archaeon]|nr:hypothetical protein [Thermoplasmatales archaeon]